MGHLGDHRATTWLHCEAGARAAAVPIGRVGGADQPVNGLTICGHNIVMRQVRIAELKARLSEYLRAVRGGETIAVLDRDTPVAQIVPFRERPALRIRKPAPGVPPLK